MFGRDLPTTGDKHRLNMEVDPQVGPYRKCCHVQTRAHGHVLLMSLNEGKYHRRIYLMLTDQVHCMYRQFSANTQLHSGTYSG